jgi:hypothetical protein
MQAKCFQKLKSVPLKLMKHGPVNCSDISANIPNKQKLKKKIIPVTGRGGP